MVNGSSPIIAHRISYYFVYMYKCNDFRSIDQIQKKIKWFFFSLQNIKPQSKHGVIYDVDVAKKKTKAGNKN